MNLRKNQVSPSRDRHPEPSRTAAAEVRELARAHIRQAMDAIVAVMLDARTSHANRLAAAQIILDRAGGKPGSGTGSDAALDFVEVLRAAAAIRTRRQQADDVERENGTEDEDMRH